MWSLTSVKRMPGPTDKWVRLFNGVWASGLAIAAIGFAASEWTSKQDLIQNGIQIDGEVTSPSFGEHGSFTYEYDVNGQTYSKEASGKAAVGDTVTLRYSPKNPQKSERTDQPSDDNTYVAFLFGFIGFGVVAGYQFYCLYRILQYEACYTAQAFSSYSAPATTSYSNASLPDNLPPAEAMPLNPLPNRVRRERQSEPGNMA